MERSVKASGGLIIGPYNGKRVSGKNETLGILLISKNL